MELKSKRVIYKIFIYTLDDKLNKFISINNIEINIQKY